MLNKYNFGVFIFLLACNTNGSDCIDESKINPEAVCTMDYTPVCGCDNITYSNACQAENSGVVRWDEGACPE